ncbi:hypothetical protein PILCRDRAFT_495662 [Piloderma croceum F 1598]|uniref:Uncharacterized protein n=1 Tax=Piloderma croceum (strain F 1598) TaxID=765440 RepID=A0A0C3B5K7_PILCF|nr:hypothetical protein PILCRDRAFT_495662 [Piloderma croceum F 1598]
MAHMSSAFNFSSPASTPSQAHTQNDFPPPTHSHSHAPPSLGFNTPSPQSFSDAPLSPIIDALMIDTLAQDFKLEPVHRANMHTFIQIGSADGTLSKSDLATRMYLLGALYADIAERHRQQQDQGSMDLKGLFNDLKIRLEGQFELTKDQMNNIRKAANDMIYEHTRVNFVMMNVDLMRHIREHDVSMGLSNVVGNPARERVLASVLKKTCSSVRNAFRQDIRDSIIGDNKCTLAEFTYRTADKYRRGQFDENMGLGYTIHNVLLHRFGLDNIELIRKVSTPSGDNNGEESDSTPPVATKRQRTQVGRIPKGEDFWGKARWLLCAAGHSIRTHSDKYTLGRVSAI